MAQAHSAFGDLAPFYQNLLHPLADPAQGLILAAVAVLLARQPRETMRIAFGVLIAAAAVAVILHPFLTSPVPNAQLVGGATVCIGLLALWGGILPMAFAVSIAAAGALFAGLATDSTMGLRASVIGGTGALIGIALFVLLVWGVVDLAQDKFGRVAGAVAGSWVAAIGFMTIALPA